MRSRGDNSAVWRKLERASPGVIRREVLLPPEGGPVSFELGGLDLLQAPIARNGVQVELKCIVGVKEVLSHEQRIALPQQLIPDFLVLLARRQKGKEPL